jgi:CRISPR-associated protein Cas5, subtype I-C/DVULG
MAYGITLHVSGDFACFSRPELHVERLSYEVITPSAARGILEAIYWKPQIAWRVDRIHVLNPIRFTTIRRNEIAVKASERNARSAMNAGRGDIGILIEDHRQQRAATLLREVSYVIEAHFDILDRRFERGGPEMSGNDAAGKHLDMFNRRARLGQCFHQPYLGTREFPARFSLVEGSLPASQLPDDQRNRDLGLMFHDFVYIPDPKGKVVESNQRRRLRAEARFFHARLRNGVMDVPPLSQTLA